MLKLVGSSWIKGNSSSRNTIFLEATLKTVTYRHYQTVKSIYNKLNSFILKNKSLNNVLQILPTLQGHLMFIVFAYTGSNLKVMAPVSAWDRNGADLTSIYTLSYFLRSGILTSNVRIFYKCLWNSCCLIFSLDFGHLRYLVPYRVNLK